jgi:TatD DNase family protein
MVIDTHAHLADDAFTEDIDEVIAQARVNGVEKILCVADDLNTSLKAVSLRDKYMGVSATVGIHPHHAEKVDESEWPKMRSVLDEKVVSAIGEIGLDYHYDFSGKEAQKNVLKRQLELAKEYGLPVILHSRESEDDVLDMLEKVYQSPVQGVLHSFWGNSDQARRGIDLGLYIGISGAITFKNASGLREVVKKIPVDRMVVETDAPYLAPIPYRGRRNEPKYMISTINSLAQLLDLSVEYVKEKTSNNARELLRI